MPLHIVKRIDNDTIINLTATDENAYFVYDNCNKCINFNVKDIEKVVPRPDCGKCDRKNCIGRVFPTDKAEADTVKKVTNTEFYIMEKIYEAKERYKNIAIKASASFLVGGIVMGIITALILRYLL